MAEKPDKNQFFDSSGKPVTLAQLVSAASKTPQFKTAKKLKTGEFLLALDPKLLRTFENAVDSQAKKMDKAEERRRRLIEAETKRLVNQYKAKSLTQVSAATGRKQIEQEAQAAASREIASLQSEQLDGIKDAFAKIAEATAQASAAAATDSLQRIAKSAGAQTQRRMVDEYAKAYKKRIKTFGEDLEDLEESQLTGLGKFVKTYQERGLLSAIGKSAAGALLKRRSVAALTDKIRSVREKAFIKQESLQDIEIKRRDEAFTEAQTAAQDLTMQDLRRRGLSKTAAEKVGAQVQEQAQARQEAGATAAISAFAREPEAIPTVAKPVVSGAEAQQEQAQAQAPQQAMLEKLDDIKDAVERGGGGSEGLLGAAGGALGGLKNLFSLLMNPAVLAGAAAIGSIIYATVQIKDALKTYGTPTGEDLKRAVGLGPDESDFYSPEKSKERAEASKKLRAQQGPAGAAQPPPVTAAPAVTPTGAAAQLAAAAPGPLQPPPVTAPVAAKLPKTVSSSQARKQASSGEALHQMILTGETGGLAERAAAPAGAAKDIVQEVIAEQLPPEVAKPAKKPTSSQARKQASSGEALRQAILSGETGGLASTVQPPSMVVPTQPPPVTPAPQMEPAIQRLEPVPQVTYDPTALAERKHRLRSESGKMRIEAAQKPGVSNTPMVNDEMGLGYVNSGNL